MKGFNDIFEAEKIGLGIYYSGTQNCEKGHYYGPAIRDHFLIHYIHSGSGIFKINKKTFYLKEHQGFLICPGEVAYYKADEIAPWSYSWVAFKGKHVEDYLYSAYISKDNPIFNDGESLSLEECVNEIIRVNNVDMYGKEVRLVGLSYILLSYLINEAFTSQYGSYSGSSEHKNGNLEYVQKAVGYIYKNYWRKVTINEIASHVMLERKYFSSIFKKEMNTSPINFLLQFRMRKACEMLREKNYTVAEVARSVGYTDPLVFSRSFKKHMNLSPTEFQMKQLNI